MNDLARELIEDIRAERMGRLWNSFGKLMVAVSIAVILGTIAVVIMQDQRRSHAMESTTELIKGIDRIAIEDYKNAIVIFDSLSRDKETSYYGLAMLRKAQAQTALNDYEGAWKTYRELAQNDPVYGDLASLLLPVDDSKPITPSKDSPFYYSHSEARGWQLLRQGKKDEAVATFMALHKDNAIPVTMRHRLQEVLDHIAPEVMIDNTNVRVTANE